MGTAKVVSMSVMPLQASLLCFEVGGILGELDVQLGAPVTAFDFAGCYATLGSAPIVTGDPSRLQYDFLAIQGLASAHTLAALRAEPAKAVLDKAINARQNAYYAKYGSTQSAAIIAQMNQNYTIDPSSPHYNNSKAQRLALLAGLALEQQDLLQHAYSSDGRPAVVMTTKSVLKSETHSHGSSGETGQSSEIAQEFTSANGLPEGGNISSPPASGAPLPEWNSTAPATVDLQEGSSSNTSTSKGSAHEHQTIVNTDYTYRVPSIENAAQNHRAQISLMDEQFALFMQSQNLPYLAQVFINELSSIDSDVYQLQIAFLNTILMSPIAGTVTGIYKNPGDAVQAGEPVIRVENDSTVLLVATLIYRGPITVGSSVTVETTLFDAPGPPTTVPGSVVAVRGQREDDQWLVIAQCDNQASGSGGGGGPSPTIFPLGYQFDYDNTTVSIT